MVLAVTRWNQMQSNEVLFSFFDWLTDAPRGGRLQKWVVGAGLAFITMIYGISCVITQRATVPKARVRGLGGLNQGMFTELGGNAAIVFCILVMFISLFMHFQWFWGNHPRLSAYYEIGKYGALIGFIATALYVAYTSMGPFR